MFPYASLFQWDVGKFTDSYRMLSVDLGIERIRHSFWYVTKASRNVWASWQGTLVTLFCTYAVMRLVGVYDDSKRIFRLWNTSYWTRSELLARHMGIDCLALIAVLMFPRYVQIDILPQCHWHHHRLAFVTLKNNLMVLSLRAMIVQFVALMLIAAFCFGGFLYALWT